MLQAAYLTIGKLAPDYENVELSVGGSTVAAAVVEATGRVSMRSGAVECVFVDTAFHICLLSTSLLCCAFIPMVERIFAKLPAQVAACVSTPEMTQLLHALHMLSMDSFAWT